MEYIKDAKYSTDWSINEAYISMTSDLGLDNFTSLACNI